MEREGGMEVAELSLEIIASSACTISNKEGCSHEGFSVRVEEREEGAVNRSDTDTRGVASGQQQ